MFSNLFAKGHPMNPYTEQEKLELTKEDNREVWEIWQDNIVENGFDKMSLTDLVETKNQMIKSGDRLLQSVSFEIRRRKNKSDKRTVRQQYAETGIENIH